MLVLPSPVVRSETGDEVRRYLTFITKDKVCVHDSSLSQQQAQLIKCLLTAIKLEPNYCADFLSLQVGLMLLPHDGNPHNSVAFIAHPRQASSRHPLYQY